MAYLKVWRATGSLIDYRTTFFFFSLKSEHESITNLYIPDHFVGLFYYISDALETLHILFITFEVFCLKHIGE